jgi:hypothetical protein
MGLDAAIDLGWDRRCLTGFALQGRSLALGDEGLADAGDGVEMHAQGGRDVGVDAVAAGAVAIAQEQDLGMADLLDWCVPVAGDLLKTLALLG